MSADNRQYAADTHTGLQRQHNEDCFEADAELGLWLVADGVGGHACGEVASEITRRTIVDHVRAGSTLPDSVRAAHDAVLRAIAERDDAEGMGSTVVALKLKGREYELCWVGDSRAYIWSGRLEQVSEDHNRVSELLASNLITPEQAGSHPERHVLTQSIGVSAAMDLEPGYRSGTLAAGSSFLLCSDGLTDELSDSLIAHLLAEHESPRARVDALIAAALEAGGRDNITAAVIGELEYATSDLSEDEVEAAHSSRRSASGGMPNDGKFPLKSLLLLGALALLVLLAFI